MRSFFVWAGETSLSKGLTVERCPAFGAGQRIVEKTTVPGKSGDLVFDTGAFSNYTQSYEIWFRDKSAGMTSAAKSIATWLLSPSGYQRLEDTYDPDVFRMAVYTGPMEIENWMLTYGRATLDFDCMPQRWLKSGEIPVSVKNGDVILNQWQKTKPLLIVSGNGTLEINDSVIQISGTSGQYFIDCETENAYQNEISLNANLTVENNLFPVLRNGETQISFTGIDSLQIVPRWWSN